MLVYQKPGRFYLWSRYHLITENFYSDFSNQHNILKNCVIENSTYLYLSYAQKSGAIFSFMVSVKCNVVSTMWEDAIDISIKCWVTLLTQLFHVFQKKDWLILSKCFNLVWYVTISMFFITSRVIYLAAFWVPSTGRSLPPLADGKSEAILNEWPAMLTLDIIYTVVGILKGSIDK